MLEILNLRKTANGFLINGLTETIEGDENYENALDWQAEGKEVMPQYTQGELDEQAFQNKWQLVDEYMDMLTVTSDTSPGGNKFNVNPQGIINIQNAMKGMISTDTKYWVERWASFDTNLVEMEWVLKEAERLRDLKIKEVGL